MTTESTSASAAPADTDSYDAVLLVSFGGPEGPDDVMPFLENVLRGKNVPRERMLEVAEHYHHFGGVSPINTHCRDLLDPLPRVIETPNDRSAARVVKSITPDTCDTSGSGS